jgi:glycosyltransferase involved in cell wall biosynthesis
MRSVVEGYGASGIFDRRPAQLLWTHDNTTLPARLMLALRTYAECLWMLLRGQVVLIHAHAAMRGSFWRKSVFVALGRLFGVPVLLHLHGSETVKFFEGLPAPLRWVVRTVLESATRVIVLSPTWKAFVDGFAPRAKVTVLPNYVKVPGVSPTARRSMDAGNLVKILFLGAVGRRKGVYPLIEAFAKARAVLPCPVSLQIGGDGEIAQCRALAERLQVASNVEFLGWVGAAERDTLLKDADIFVLPSLNEGLPMSLLEAMAAGLPVISTRVGGIPDLVTDGENGLLVDAGDVDALADAIVRMTTNAAERRAIAERGYVHVAKFYSEDVVVPRLEGLYAEAVRGKN